MQLRPVPPWQPSSEKQKTAKERQNEKRHKNKMRHTIDKIDKRWKEEERKHKTTNGASPRTLDAIGVEVGRRLEVATGPVL
jgi:hypothetical protein